MQVVDEQGVPYTTSQVLSAEPWTPSPYTAFKVLYRCPLEMGNFTLRNMDHGNFSLCTFQVILSARLGAAVWSGISDCDETFNYWEPAHFMLYGHGLQTWEYQVVCIWRKLF